MKKTQRNSAFLTNGRHVTSTNAAVVVPVEEHDAALAHPLLSRSRLNAVILLSKEPT